MVVHVADLKVNRKRHREGSTEPSAGTVSNTIWQAIAATDKSALDIYYGITGCEEEPNRTSF
jgi:hypothetical protein